MKKTEPKISGYKVLKDPEPKNKAHSRQQTFKSKVLNNPKPYYKENLKIRGSLVKLTSKDPKSTST